MATEYDEKKQSQGGVGTDLSRSVTKTVSGNNTYGGAQDSGKSIEQMGKGADFNKNYGEVIGSSMGSVPQFQPSDDLTAAQNYLSQVTANKPGAYVSKYTKQLDDLYGQLMGRGPFKYDMNGDALYKQYQQRYTEAGKRGMRDAMGQAAANTGGYASSYAQTAGQDAYNQYMQQLQQAVPELASQAQQRYDNETDMMRNRYNMAQNADQNAYGRYRDSYADWQNEREYAQNEAQQRYANEYNEFAGNMNSAMNMAGWQREDAAIEKNNAANMVNLWMNAKITPSRDMVEKAGMDYDQFLAYWKKVK